MSIPPFNTPRRDGAPGSPRAFTLVELLVSVTILAVLVGVLARVLNASVTGWQRAETRTDTFREARAALTLMARDVSQTIAPTLFTPNGGLQQPAYPTLVLDRYPDPGSNDDIATVSNDPFEQVHCMTLVPNGSPSALCAVSYFCRWDDTRKTYGLARRLVNSTNTFNRFKAATPAHSAPSGSTPPTSVLRTPLAFLDLFVRVAPTDDPQTRDPSIVTPDANDLAAYVWDLQFRVDTNLQVQPTPVGSAQTPAVDHSTPSPRTYAIPSPYPNALPAYLEIRFKALSSNAGARLRGSASREAWVNSGTPSDKNLYRTAILPNSQQFVRRVPLNNVPAPATN